MINFFASKWKTNNVTKMSHIFSGCKSLSSFPDILKWNVNNVSDMSNIFSGCASLSFCLIYQYGTLIMLLI